MVGEEGGKKQKHSEEVTVIIQKRDDGSFGVIAVEAKSGQMQEIYRY